MMMLAPLCIGLGFVSGCLVTFGSLIFYLRSNAAKRSLSQLLVIVEEQLIDIATRLIVNLLSKPEVVDAVTKLIAKGINTWVVDINSQQNLRDVFRSNDKEAMKELGRKLPGMMSSFSSGIVSGVFKGKKTGEDDRVNCLTAP